MTDAARPSVIIPAHDEARHIEACLASIDAEGAFDVVVVCNGCDDDTARVARRHGHGVRVLELAEADKAAALNAGDRAVSSYPRVYVDADVVFDAGALRALVAAIDHGARAASPTATVTVEGSSRPVRSYYAIWERLGVVRTGLCGAGVYALSEAGRGRFADFPSLIADDLFVDQRFSSAERVTVEPGVTYPAPQNLRALIRRKTRVFAGNLELAREGPPCHPGRQSGQRWFQVIARAPRLWPAAPCYVGVSIVAKCRAHWRLMRAGPLWVER